MKIIKYKHILVVLLLLFSSGTYAQEQGDNFTLENPETGQKTYEAKEYITLKPGFSFTASENDNFHAKVSSLFTFLPQEGITGSAPSYPGTDNDGIVGAIPGSAGVSGMGGATYTIPIQIPAGINGMQPNIAITYNSQGGNGLLGLGANLSGISAITRSANNPYYDNGVFHAVSFDGNDKFALNGQRLLKQNDTLYYTENDQITRVIASAEQQGDAPKYFWVKTKEGITMEFGQNTNTTHSAVMLGTKQGVYVWLLNKIIDVNGNYVEYIYGQSNGEFWIDEIRYTGNASTLPFYKVKFNYTIRTDQSFGVVAGEKIYSTKLLQSIDIKYGEEPLNKYSFNYNTSDINTRLISVGLQNTTGEKINETILEWGNLSTVNENNLSINFENAVPIDIKNDGITDLLIRYKKNDQYFENYFLNKDNTFVAAGTEYNSEYELEFEDVLDFNGDGYLDYYRTGHGDMSGADPYPVIKIWNGIDFVNVGQIDLARDRDFKHISGDFDGNGKDELLIITDAGYIQKLTFENIFLSTGKPFISEQDYDNIKKTLVGDFNGDGKLDFGILINSTLKAYTLIDNLVVPVLTYTIPSTVHAKLQASDFNGDGVTDLAYYTAGNIKFCSLRSTSQEVVTTEISTPHGEYVNITMLNPSCLYSNNLTMSNETSGTKILNYYDFNNDGKMDILCNLSTTYTFKSTNSSELSTAQKNYLIAAGCEVLDNDKGVYYKGNRHFIAYSKGDGTFRFSNLIYNYSYKNSSYLNKTFVADFNGDGISELYGSDGTSFVLPNSINFVTKVSDGLNNTVEFDYTTFNNPNSTIYTQDSGATFPYNDFSGAGVLAVEKITRSNAASLPSVETYHYEGGKIHRQGRGFLGFEKTTVSENLSGTEITSINQLNTTFKLFTPLSTTTKVNGTLVSTQTNTISLSDKGNKMYSMQVDAAKSIDHLKNITTTKSFTYDGWGNILTETASNGSGTTTTTNEYGSFGSFAKNKITHSTVTATRNSESKSRTNNFEYDSKGNLTKSIKDLGDAKEVVTSFNNYNSFGYPKTITTSAADVSATSEILTYTADGRFVESKTNSLGVKILYEYDYKWGVKTKESNSLNSLTTEFQFDDWGRIYKTTNQPEGLMSVSGLLWADGKGPTNAAYYSYKASSGIAPEITWYDNAGRQLRSETIGFGGKKVYVDTYYKSNGKVDKVSDPYYEGETAKHTQFTYDAYGREIAKTLSTGDVVSTKYNDASNSVTVTAPNTNITKVFNKFGEVLTSTDNISGQSVSYEYYANGLVKSTTPSTGEAVTMEYDLQGNRTKITDPDAGTIETTYNSLGELLTQTDERNNVTTNHYDTHGRITSVDRTGLESINYTYNPTTHQLSSISDGTHLLEYTYDDKWRVKETKETIDSKEFVTKVSYDDLGRVLSEEYPTGYTITNSYEAESGLLTEVFDNNLKSIWKLNSMSALGQVMSETKGNGKTTTYTYDAHHRPQTVITAGVSEWQYEFDATTGNLNYRKDLRRDKTESFSYDNLNRLTTASINGAANYLNLTYQSNGNILSKTDAATMYKYEDPRGKLHAVTELIDPKNIPSINQNISYTSFNKVESITEGDKRLEFTYGIDNLRRKTEYFVNGTSTQTKYFIGSYEEEISASDTRKIHYLPGGAVFIMNNQYPQGKMYYTYGDYLGSILAITDDAGNVVEEQSFDPWGRLRNIGDWSYTNAVSLSLLDRGYTGHQHLYNFGIINMNGRLYDPVLGRMLSPDPYIQLPGFAQNYNRYSYVWNNPLRFSDPDGEWVHIVIGAVIGGVINLAVHWNQIDSFWDGVVAFGIGAGAGAIGAATGGAAFIAAGGGAAGAGGFAAGFAGGAIGSAFSSPIQSIGNSLYFGDPMMTGGEFLTGVLLGGVTGGSVNGVSALAHGKTFLNGSLKPSTVSISNSTVSLPKLEDPEIRLENPIQRADVADATFNQNISNSTLNSDSQIIRKIGDGCYKVEDLATVGRWMNDAEYEAMKATGKIQIGAGGKTSVSTGGFDSFPSATRGSVYVEFQVPKVNLVSGGKANWYSIVSPGASRSQIFMLQKQGGYFSQDIFNLSNILKIK